MFENEHKVFSVFFSCTRACNIVFTHTHTLTAHNTFMSLYFLDLRNARVVLLCVYLVLGLSFTADETVVRLSNVMKIIISHVLLTSTHFHLKAHIDEIKVQIKTNTRMRQKMQKNVSETMIKLHI